MIDLEENGHQPFFLDRRLFAGMRVMVPRVLESEAMETEDEARDYDEMDHSEVNARFVNDFLKVHGSCRGGEILDVGTGPGQIPIRLCGVDPRARVLGIDLSESMLEAAERNVEIAGIKERIRFALGDAKEMTLAEGGYEAVISNSLVHHIPTPSQVLAEMARLVAPGGTLMVRDLYRPEDQSTIAALVSRYAGGESASARSLFEASLNAALTLEEIQEVVRSLGMSEKDVSMSSDRHWTWIWRRPA